MGKKGKIGGKGCSVHQSAGNSFIFYPLNECELKINMILKFFKTTLFQGFWEQKKYPTRRRLKVNKKLEILNSKDL